MCVGAREAGDASVDCASDRGEEWCWLRKCGRGWVDGEGGGKGLIAAFLF